MARPQDARVADDHADHLVIDPARLEQVLYAVEVADGR